MLHTGTSNLHGTERRAVCAKHQCLLSRVELVVCPASTEEWQRVQKAGITHIMGGGPRSLPKPPRSRPKSRPEEALRMASCAASLCTSEMVFGPSTVRLSTQALNLRSMTSCGTNQTMSGPATPLPSSLQSTLRQGLGDAKLQQTAMPLVGCAADGLLMPCWLREGVDVLFAGSACSCSSARTQPSAEARTKARHIAALH